MNQTEFSNQPLSGELNCALTTIHVSSMITWTTMRDDFNLINSLRIKLFFGSLGFYYHRIRRSLMIPNDLV